MKKDVLTSKNKTWHELYEKHINEDFKNFDEYFKIKMRLKKVFFKLIVKYSNNQKPLLECGCGTGKFSAYLASLGYKTYAMDIEDAMVKQTIELSKRISPNNKVNVLKGNVIKIPFSDKYFSVAHSSGVLEHYSDKEIVELINEQIRAADYCIFSVPTPYFKTKMLGNERFIYRKGWRKIISNSNAKIIEETGYHYKTFEKRLIDILKDPTYIFRPIALYVFVLKGKENE